jgi:hypothetical protein
MKMSGNDKYINYIMSIRKLPAIDAIEEACSRAVEMGRPVIFPMGQGTLIGAYAAQQIAGIAIANYAAEICAKLGTPYIVTTGISEVLTVIESSIKESYVAAGHPEEFTQDTVRFLSPYQMAYAAGVAGIMERERPAANIMIGAYYAETAVFTEAGAQIGAIQIGGSARITQMCFFAGICDYMLIGEEIFAAAAYITKEPKELATILSADIIKFGSMFLIFIGLIEVIFGGSLIKSILKI